MDAGRSFPLDPFLKNLLFDNWRAHLHLPLATTHVT